LVPVDRATGERTARPGEVKRLGDKPVVIGFASGDGMIEVAARVEHRTLVAGPLTTPHTRASAVNLIRQGGDRWLQ
jgi:hypothetical protein